MPGKALVCNECTIPRQDLWCAVADLLHRATAKIKYASSRRNLTASGYAMGQVITRGVIEDGMWRAGSSLWRVADRVAGMVEVRKNAGRGAHLLSPRNCMRLGNHIPD